MRSSTGVFVFTGLAGTCLAAIAVAFAGRPPAWSVGIGAFVALVNLWALRGVVAVLTQAAATGRASALGFFVMPKVVALLGVVWLLLRAHVVAAAPLAVGYAALPIGVAITAMVCDKA